MAIKRFDDLQELLQDANDLARSRRVISRSRQELRQRAARVAVQGLAVQDLSILDTLGFSSQKVEQPQILYNIPNETPKNSCSRQMGNAITAPHLQATNFHF